VGERGRGCSDDEITEALEVSRSTSYRVRERFVEDSLEAALSPRAMPRRPDKIKMQGEAEKRLIALACSDPPAGRCRWTMAWLADRLVHLGYVDNVSQETVRRALKKKTSTWSK
jgi:transposase